MNLRPLLLLLPLIAGCSLVTISDPYGNLYGNWYNHGGQYTWQLSTCEAQMKTQAVPPMERKHAMRCCMWGHGVPVTDPQSCGAATG